MTSQGRNDAAISRRNDGAMPAAMTAAVARGMVVQARARHPLADHVVNALEMDGLSREDAEQVAEAAGVSVAPLRDAEAARLARQAEDVARWDRYWSQFPEHRAEGAALPGPPAPQASCPARGDRLEAVHGMARREVANSVTVTTFADVPYCDDGHANEQGAKFCRVCGRELASYSERRAARAAEGRSRGAG